MYVGEAKTTRVGTTNQRVVCCHLWTDEAVYGSELPFVEHAVKIRSDNQPLVLVGCVL